MLGISLYPSCIAVEEEVKEPKTCLAHVNFSQLQFVSYNQFSHTVQVVQVKWHHSFLQLLHVSHLNLIIFKE